MLPCPIFLAMQQNTLQNKKKIVVYCYNVFAIRLTRFIGIIYLSLMYSSTHAQKEIFEMIRNTDKWNKELL